jgi:hypothetical protein
MNMTLVPRVRTAGSIAAELNQPLHRVVYILKTRGHIQPMCRAGRLRVYSSQAVAQVRYELNCIDARGTSHDS